MTDLQIVKSEKNQNNEQAVSCPIDFAFQRIGGKHRGKILWFLHEHQVLRYGELKRLIRGITPKMLTQTLRELEQDGMILRKVYLEVPPKVEYTLTAASIELIPLLYGLRGWAQKRMVE